MKTFFLCAVIGVAAAYQPMFEGRKGGNKNRVASFKVGAEVQHFLPYNASIIYAGGHHGNGILPFAKKYAHGNLYIFEPNPAAFAKLRANAEKINAQLERETVKVFPQALNAKRGNTKLYISHGPFGDDPGLDIWSSILPDKGSNFFSGPVITVPCVNLDEWVKSQRIAKIDLLCLDIEGAEMEVLKSSPKCMEKALVIVVTSNYKMFRHKMVPFDEMRKFIESKGFTMSGHWYKKECRGQAVFVKTVVYDSLYR